jgi:type VI secretion system protein VasD
MFLKFLLTTVSALGVTACAEKPPVTPPPDTAAQATRVALHLVADPGLNPGAMGHPTPVRVRLYELRNTAHFLSADYFALVDRAQASLGADLIDQDEVLITPGEQRQVSRELDTQTRHIGLVVGYRDIDQAQWRTLLTVAPRLANAFLINLDARRVRSDASPISAP